MLTNVNNHITTIIIKIYSSSIAAKKMSHVPLYSVFFFHPLPRQPLICFLILNRIIYMYYPFESDLFHLA